MITTQTNTQTKKKEKTQKQTMQQANMHMCSSILIQGNEKSLMKFAALPAKTLHANSETDFKNRF